MNLEVLPASFYTSDDVVNIAKNLLGKVLHTNIQNKLTSGIIVETEAYRGFDDKACHAFGNKMSARTKSMFLSGGHAYVYLCYGIHTLMNVVTGPEGQANVVLIRALQPLIGIEYMMERRNVSTPSSLISNGPGKLTAAFDIRMSNDGIPLFLPDSPVFITAHTELITPENVYEGPRVGMTKRIGSCGHRPWRFYIKNNIWVSNPKHINYYEKWKYDESS